MSYREEWNLPSNYNELVAQGDAKYSILGVLTNDNMDSMTRFVEFVEGLADKIEVDDGTQIVAAHPDPAKQIVVDAYGLGDFLDSGFDVTIEDRQTPTPSRAERGEGI